MPDYAALAAAKDSLIRRGLTGAVVLAPMTSPTLDAATLFGADGAIATLPEGYFGLGRLTDAGVNLGREVTQSDMTGWGSSSPVRSDITGSTSTMELVALETNKATLQLYTGAPDSMLTPKPNGAVEIKEAEIPVPQYFRAASIARDADDQGRYIYLIRHLPRSKVTSIAAQSHNNSEDGIAYGVTLTGYKDDTYGSPGAYIFGGEGWNALIEAMGFDPIPVA